VAPDRVVTNWWRREGHSLTLDDLDKVLDALPERLLIGIGRLHPDPEVTASSNAEASRSSACARTTRSAGTGRSTHGAPLPRCT